MYTFFPLFPRIEVKRSSLLCLTVLLEPTNLRVAFVILRNEPPQPPTTHVVIFLLGLFDLGDFVSFISFLEEMCYIFPFWWNFFLPILS